jgi:hypothetical protein
MKKAKFVLCEERKDLKCDDEARRRVATENVSLCNDSVIIVTIYEMITFQLNQIQQLSFLNRYNDSQTVITVHAKNSFFSCFRRSILKGSPLSLIII